MKRLKITPFLIAMPIVFAWAVYRLIRVMNHDGMAVMMSGFFAVLAVSNIILLVMDRLIVSRINLWWLGGIEITILLVSWKLINFYLYGQ